MTVDEAVREVLRYLGGRSDKRNRVNEIALAADTTIVFEFDLNGIAAGATLEMPDGEQAYVWSVDTGTKTATVSRGQNGTTAEDLAVGDVVFVQPRFTVADIKARLQDEVNNLEAAGLYRVKESAVTYDWTNRAYDISAVTDMQVAYAVEITYGGESTWVYGPFNKTDDYLRPHVTPPVTDGTLHYKATFAAFAAGTDDLESVCGVPASAHDVLCMGAAVKLLYGKEGVRLDERAKQHGRTDEGVPATALTTLARRLDEQRMARLADEIERQVRRWPLRQA